ncbi:class I SAM-dependent methyltransferase [Sandaracinus amylolyticus]|uniref:S-adenosyl-L-methionine-dependent methyltransferase n=1 Tax=Sandaracinus amylolyticus TaxID=927083 RepID=A0A0F6YNI4_9BACT|nr:class I SAM-dependent methyltransferase [Sandaracinus amylolyticus]AKF11510.1 O-Methyltransferase [Sandaracinus amylolyticus]
MREGEASRTALGVALLRAIATSADALHDVRDPIAESLLPPSLALAPHVLARAPTVARVLSGGLLDHVALRTAAIDRALRDLFTEEPARTQLVILGAGLDARAWRLAELSRAVVFEVDVVASQRIKTRKLQHVKALAREVRFVEVDFARGELAGELEDHRHDARAPTVWLWEGVTPYLDRAAIDETLRTIEARSAPGSVLLVTYLTPEHVRVPALLLPAVKRAFAMLGEPLVGAMRTPEMHSLLRAHGFAIDDDSGSYDWARDTRSKKPVLEITERLIRATRE